jgi:hypothetical protein
VAKNKPAKAGKVRPEVRTFRTIGEHFLAETHRLFPALASSRGLSEFDAELGENDPATHQAYTELLTDALQAVEALPDHAFTGDDWLDRRGFLSELRTSLHWNGPLARWRTNPQVHCDAALDAILLLLIRNADRLKAIQPAVESRLAKLPRFLEQGAACLRAPVPLWTKLAVQSCGGAKSFFDDVARQFVPLSPKPERFQKLCAEAITAFERYAKAAAAKKPGPTNGFSIGREAFEFLLREKTGLPYSLPEVRALGESLVAQLEVELAAETRKFGKKKTAEILAEAAARWKLGAPTLLEEYQLRTGTVRDQFAAAGMATFPKGERCVVLPVPEFLRHHFPTAAYHQPPPFSPDQTGIFWVNDLSAIQTDPAKRAAEVAQHFGLDFTCAHEAYPGHHLQFVIQNQHPSHLRRLMYHAIGYEGWTLWCEKMAVDLGVIQLPEARLIQLHDALWRAHRIVIDCGLHDGTLTYATACARLMKGVGFTKARAQGDVNWYTAAPTVPLSYLLGRLENERLHAQLCGQEGWSLKQFNDWLLSHGALPQRWLWQARLHSAS